MSGDTNGVEDIFFFEYDGSRIVRLERVSVGNYATQANHWSDYPSITDDGSYVAFESRASNLVLFDRNDANDILIKDLSTGEVLRQSATLDGQPHGSSARPRLSGDANSIVFTTDAANLVANSNT